MQHTPDHYFSLETELMQSSERCQTTDLGENTLEVPMSMIDRCDRLGTYSSNLRERARVDGKNYC